MRRENIVILTVVSIFLMGQFTFRFPSTKNAASWHDFATTTQRKNNTKAASKKKKKEKEKKNRERHRERAPSSSQHPDHCFFVVSPLYGEPDEPRRNQTIEWYLRTTVPSIKNAEEKLPSSLGRVGIILRTDDIYSSSPVQELLLDREPMLILRNITYRIQETVSGMGCGIVSIMRIDADDMLLPNTFLNVIRGWNRIATNKNNYSPPHSGGNGIVMVSGTHYQKRIRIHPSTKNKGHQENPPYCYIEEYRFPALNSQGLCVTMPAPIWRDQFGGDLSVISQHHMQLLNNLKKKMEKENIAVSKNEVRDHALFVQTPLSSHYLFNESGSRECSLNYLVQELGNETGHLVSNVRSFIPRLTKEQWAENKFVKRNKKMRLRNNYFGMNMKMNMNMKRSRKRLNYSAA